jgi:tetratricopeptide (TPR) repeat protein
LGQALTQATGDRYGIGTPLYCLGLAAQAAGMPLEAQAPFEDSLALFQEIRDPIASLRNYVQLGYLMLGSGEVRAARRLFLMAASVAPELNVFLPDVLAGQASLRAQVGETVEALELVTQILKRPYASGEARGRAESLCSELERQLTPQQLKLFRAQGRI